MSRIKNAAVRTGSGSGEPPEFLLDDLSRLARRAAPAAEIGLRDLCQIIDVAEHDAGQVPHCRFDIAPDCDIDQHDRSIVSRLDGGKPAADLTRC